MVIIPLNAEKVKQNMIKNKKRTILIKCPFYMKDYLICCLTFAALPTLSRK